MTVLISYFAWWNNNLHWKGNTLFIFAISLKCIISYIFGRARWISFVLNRPSHTHETRFFLSQWNHYVLCCSSTWLVLQYWNALPWLEIWTILSFFKLYIPCQQALKVKVHLIWILHRSCNMMTWTGLSLMKTQNIVLVIYTVLRPNTHTPKFVINMVFRVQGAPLCCKRNHVNNLIWYILYYCSRNKN